MTVPEALKILGVEWGTSDANFIARARRNWRRLIMECHPDRGGDVDRAKELNQAMDVVRTIGTKLEEPHVYYAGPRGELWDRLERHAHALEDFFGSLHRKLDEEWPDWGYTG